MKTMKNVVVFSLDTQDRVATAEEYEQVLESVGGLLAMGCYKGAKEQSIIADISELSNILYLARQYGQESILVVGSDKAALQYLSNAKTEVIGSAMIQVSRDTAMSKDAYTRYNNEYYIVE